MAWELTFAPFYLLLRSWDFSLSSRNGENIQWELAVLRPFYLTSFFKRWSNIFLCSFRGTVPLFLEDHCKFMDFKDLYDLISCSDFFSGCSNKTFFVPWDPLEIGSCIYIQKREPIRSESQWIFTNWTFPYNQHPDQDTEHPRSIHVPLVFFGHCFLVQQDTLSSSCSFHSPV